MESDIVAKTLIILDNDMALLLRRSSTDRHRPNEFDLPGGGIESEEMMKSGASREITEETGLTIADSDMQLVWTKATVKNRREGRRNVVRMLYVGYLSLAADANIILNPKEHDYYELLPVGEIADKLDHSVWSEGIKYVIENGLLRDPTSDHVAS